jgi:hypothetical protein
MVDYNYGINSAPPPVGYHDQFHGAREVDWSEPGLYVTRFRIVSDPGHPAWDVSYCHGRIGDEPVRVRLPFSQLAKHSFKYKQKDGTIGKGGWRAHLIAWGKKEGVNVYRLGMIDNVSQLN